MLEYDTRTTVLSLPLSSRAMVYHLSEVLTPLSAFIWDMVTVLGVPFRLCDLKMILQKIILTHRVGYYKKDKLIIHSPVTLHCTLRVSDT